MTHSNAANAFNKKGSEHDGKCARLVCHNPNAIFWNTSTRMWYCKDCAAFINKYRLNIREDGSPLCQKVGNHELPT